MNVDIIKTASLGNRGYLVSDGTNAIAVDVQRDYERWQEAAVRADVTITHVLETHMHNDYVTGGFRLAELTGATYVVPVDSRQSFAAQEAADGETFATGKLQVRALHTPGHTPSHISYVVDDGTATAVFSGGGVLYGTVGRPDLISETMTTPLAEAQYESAHKLSREVRATAHLYPTHGFGSFCASAPGSGADASTLADEQAVNIAFTSRDKAEFVSTILSGLSAYPRYYAHMGAINQSGPGDMTIKPVERLSADQLRNLLAHDEWVIDIRNRRAYAAQHPAGAAGFELSDAFSSYVGWLIPWGDSITLVGDNEADLTAAQVQLGRIGMDGFVGRVTADLPAYLDAGQPRSYPITSFETLAKVRARDSVVLLDVRAPVEWHDGHVAGAVNIPLYDLLTRLGELPPGKTIWVYCGSGYRASIAVSLLDRAGLAAGLVDDDFAQAKAHNLLAG